jgi:alpha-tubulin suppressor-like RCC1 family protein
VQTIAAGNNWKQVSIGWNFMSAIKTDGTLWVWGFNAFGQLGTDDLIGYSSPVQTIAAGTNWRQVDCGNQHMGAIKTDGTLWMWGENFYGQLATNDKVGRSSPVQTIAGGTNWKQLACGEASTQTIKTDGRLWVWGLNEYGQLATEDNDERISPVQTITGGTNWKQVSVGQFCAAAIRDDSSDLFYQPL